jgi:flavin-dependent dehydrogenase
LAAVQRELSQGRSSLQAAARLFSSTKNSRGRNLAAAESPTGALQQYPFLAEAGSGHPVEHCELISPSGKRVRFRLQHPVAVFSRLALNGLVLDRARHAGVVVHQERITRIDRDGDAWRLSTPQGEWKDSYVILAAGARSSLRGQFLPSTPQISTDDLMVTAGYFIPGRSSLMQIQFLKEITGYIWVFPRSDHASAGIACKMGEISTAELRRILEHWLETNGVRTESATFYSHILPSFRSQTFDTLNVSGDGWAMIGDSAGLVDPITGEGLYYALKSANLCASAL